MTQPGYRADIDGLRAVAIIPVLLFHARVPGFSGGYVGVDVFFVISGFLIAGIIAREVDEGRFSILHFYERRARRIMPALLAMIVAVLTVAAVLFLPDDFDNLAGASASATLFVSNLWFFAHAGYFAGEAETMPLLHTWSLAVEEQFYIGFPLVLILVTRFLPRRRNLVVALCTMASFALAVATQGRGDGIAFYLSPPRAWELLAGSLLALGVIPAVTSRLLRDVMAALGLAAIAAAICLFDKTTVFPGVTALAPVLGAAAIIHAGRDTMVARLLAARPLVGIGLISYSLYLWHWPLIVFSTYATDAKLSGWGSVAVILGSVGLATLSWRYIERPFRDGVRFDRRRIFRWTGGGMAVACLIAATIAVRSGWPGRFAPDVARLASASTDFSPMRKRCHDSDPARGRPPCVLGTASAPDSIMWGDSHGVELAYALSERPERRGHGLIQQTHSSCPPVVGDDIAGRPQCRATNQAILARIRADPRLRTVYLAGFWASYAKAPLRFWQELDSTIAALVASGRHVVLIGAVPPSRVDVPRRLTHLAQAGRLDEAAGIGMTRATLAAETQSFRALASRWQARGVTYLDPADRLCDSTQCSVFDGRNALYFDKHHLSMAGARRVLSGTSVPG